LRCLCDGSSPQRVAQLNFNYACCDATLAITLPRNGDTLRVARDAHVDSRNSLKPAFSNQQFDRTNQLASTTVEIFLDNLTIPFEKEMSIKSRNVEKIER